ncbi:hypothetical protein [Poseidonibacter ostreae]|jgi:hypothetical protein|uniref:Uncharacterized protein n=1 Tax=Poseidonibacter ostreae TaxID=2654171 RepID=A0A6L4WTH9_9BACT|nr:hypothetical protein [Poseidonibacter ostreae]KAB7885534.1 hypothetical protein GA417_08285 [Poseidonibacter ostreae]KAB7888487.1 hypothetical protein GBG19_08865 [Poseidonibacter ostreae]KAB7890746.1 hypothetical protein GBG18_08405 [Poseidonibacter ostreae]MAC85198.1 hypothetical protein [Arcobacter sp.]
MNRFKYLHIYLPVFFVLWIGLFIDSKLVANHFVNNQYITNILVLIVFVWIYLKVSVKIKKLMLYGLILAFLGEALFALVLGMYTYRLENLPLYVPLGHSMIYAAVFYIAKEPILKINKELSINILFVLMLIYSTAWLVFANDVFGFLCMLVIVYLFRRKPHTKLFFLIMFFMIVYLELIGTYYENWYWPEIWFDKISFIPSANPPSGISVFYFGFDVGCLLIYKLLNKQKWKRLRNLQKIKREKI